MKNNKQILAGLIIALGVLNATPVQAMEQPKPLTGEALKQRMQQQGGQGYTPSTSAPVVPSKAWWQKGIDFVKNPVQNFKALVAETEKQDADKAVIEKQETDKAQKMNQTIDALKQEERLRTELETYLSAAGATQDGINNNRDVIQLLVDMARLLADPADVNNTFANASVEKMVQAVEEVRLAGIKDNARDFSIDESLADISSFCAAEVRQGKKHKEVVAGAMKIFQRLVNQNASEGERGMINKLLLFAKEKYDAKIAANKQAEAAGKLQSDSTHIAVTNATDINAIKFDAGLLKKLQKLGVSWNVVQFRLLNQGVSLNLVKQIKADGISAVRKLLTNQAENGKITEAGIKDLTKIAGNGTAVTITPRIVKPIIIPKNNGGHNPPNNDDPIIDPAADEDKEDDEEVIDPLVVDVPVVAEDILPEDFIANLKTLGISQDIINEIIANKGFNENLENRLTQAVNAIDDATKTPTKNAVIAYLESIGVVNNTAGWNTDLLRALNVDGSTVTGFKEFLTTSALTEDEIQKVKNDGFSTEVLKSLDAIEADPASTDAKKHYAKLMRTLHSHLGLNKGLLNGLEKGKVSVVTLEASLKSIGYDDQKIGDIKKNGITNDDRTKFKAINDNPASTQEAKDAAKLLLAMDEAGSFSFMRLLTVRNVALLGGGVVAAGALAVTLWRFISHARSSGVNKNLEALKEVRGIAQGDEASEDFEAIASRLTLVSAAAKTKIAAAIKARNNAEITNLLNAEQAALDKLKAQGFFARIKTGLKHDWQSFKNVFSSNSSENDDEDNATEDEA